MRILHDLTGRKIGVLASQAGISSTIGISPMKNWNVTNKYQPRWGFE